MDFELAPSRRLRLVLADLGPIFSAFGLYLSTRADLWPVNYCLELGAIPDAARTTPPHQLRELLKKEIGCSPEAAFSEIEVKPFESRLLFQSHHARLTDGAEVIVKIIHPEVESEFSGDLELLSLLKGAFAACGLSDAAFGNAVADFSYVLHKQINFANETRALQALAQDAEDYDVLCAPRVQEQLSSSKVLTVEKLDGARLSETLVFKSELSAIDDWAGFRSFGFERNELARLLCEIWLRQALLGRAFPIEPRPENILVLPRKQLAFSGGPFAVLPPEPQANLWNYLVAAANDQSDKACSCLLRELREEGDVRTDLVQRFRQAMPFRDGGWDASRDCHTLAELLFVQWRFASECGFTPLMHLPAFYRGLFSIANTARRVAPQIDSLAEGVRDLRLVTGLAHFRNVIGPQQLGDQMDKYAAMIVDMPYTFDEALTFMSDGRGNIQPGHAGAYRGKENTSTIVATLLLVSAAIVLLAHHFAGTGSGWVDKIFTIAVFTGGLLWLRAIGRS